jgi:hypothetical protein
VIAELRPGFRTRQASESWSGVGPVEEFVDVGPFEVPRLHLEREHPVWVAQRKSGELRSALTAVPVVVRARRFSTSSAG